MAYPVMVPPKVFPRFQTKLINIDSSGMSMRNRLRLIPVFVSQPIAVNIILDTKVMIVNLCAMILQKMQCRHCCVQYQNMFLGKWRKKSIRSKLAKNSIPGLRRAFWCQGSKIMQIKKVPCPRHFVHL